MIKVLKLIGRAIAEPHKIRPFIHAKMERLKKRITPARDRWLRYKYRHQPYSRFYSAVMRRMASKDPKAAVGGLWKEIGSLQFEFLVEDGLRPSHRLLDFGCGCLRAGIHFIDYLDEGNYFGMDISSDILDAGRRFAAQAGLMHKKFVLRNNQNLEFRDFPGEEFDYIIAQSVFTHMPIEDIQECFKNIGRVMHPDTVFFATFHDGGTRAFVERERVFFYPFNTLRAAAKRYGYQARLVEGYAHPRNQKMMRITSE